mmetsp:Transcript_36595/g.76171  ORF Transcript_36595/g.76171 Transcript_36595/m.76171 type:complete len:84 (-) Transcript_36595:1098-1349(-)
MWQPVVIMELKWDIMHNSSSIFLKWDPTKYVEWKRCKGLAIPLLIWLLLDYVTKNHEFAKCRYPAIRDAARDESKRSSQWRTL